MTKKKNRLYIAGKKKYSDRELKNPAKCFKRDGWWDLTFFNQIVEGREAKFTFNGGIYSGMYKELENGIKIPHGKGKFILPKIFTYEGEYIDGRMNGQGLYTIEGQGTFTGTLFDNMRREGTYVFKDGRQFEGHWNNDQPDYGTFTLSDGTKVYGHYKDWKLKDGDAWIRYPNGDDYSGIVVDGIPNGKGKFWNKKEGRHYEGEFKKGEFYNGQITAGYPSKVVARCTNGVIVTEQERKRMRADQRMRAFGNFLQGIAVGLNAGMSYYANSSNGGMMMFNNYVGPSFNSPSAMGYTGRTHNMLPPALQPDVAAKNAVETIKARMKAEEELFKSNYSQNFKRIWGREPSEMEYSNAWSRYLEAMNGSYSESNSYNGSYESTTIKSSSNTSSSDKGWYTCCPDVPNFGIVTYHNCPNCGVNHQKGGGHMCKQR